MPEKPTQCQLCWREKPLTFHHLIPRSNHKNKWFRKQFELTEMRERGIYVCRPCHSKIHLLYDEKVLGRYFNTLELLLANAEMQKFIGWVQKQK